VSEPLESPPQPTGGDYAPSPLERFAVWQRAGGVVLPLMTAVLAFIIGGLVVLGTGKNPLSVYRAVFNGTGLNWLFPWVSGQERTLAALNLQQTLIVTTSLILTGLAVAFAFRCGMFNIGGPGQYLVGAYFAVWVGSTMAGLPSALHIFLAVTIATLAGAVFAGIAGFLKATVGAHEVISTIMLNWIAIWVGSYLFGLGGALQNSTQKFVPISNDVVDKAKLPVFWGDPILQGLHVGFFIALAALVVYWIVLNRTTLGYQVRAVGFNPEAARYGGINVPRNFVLAMAISGAFAGLAGAVDILGWQFRISQNDIGPTSNIVFIGIAVALLGRNTAIGVLFAALLFGALLTGTSTRHLNADIFRPDLAGNLTQIIQGLIVLFVGADLLILAVWNQRKRLKPGRKPA
jgi:general nucleoside transport system permease protein